MPTETLDNSNLSNNYDGSANVNINNDYNLFLQVHQSQLVNSQIPETNWQSLFEKLQNESFDAGSSFGLQKVIHNEDENNYTWRVICTQADGLKTTDTDSIFLIDHCWTYEPHKARDDLMSYPGLAERMGALMNIPIADLEIADIRNKVLKEMWRYNQTYSVYDQSTGMTKLVWYILDEFGSRVQHSDFPNIKIVPFIYQSSTTIYTYSIMFLLNDLEYNDEVFRNYIERPITETERKILLLPWVNDDNLLSELKSESLLQLPDESEEHFLAYRELEKFNENETVETEKLLFSNFDNNKPCKIYSEVKLVCKENLPNNFQFVDTIDEADLLYLIQPFKDFHKLKANQFVNQVIGECVLTVKDLCSIISRRSIEGENVDIIDVNNLSTRPNWFPITFNLSTELKNFICYFQLRKERQLDNVWIIKPWNSTKSQGCIISDDLNQILRQLDCGKRIASKYISNTLTLDLESEGGSRSNVKIDFRFIILVASVNPLKIGFLRHVKARKARKNYDLNCLDDRQSHFTDFETADFLRTEEFVACLKQQYPILNWDTIEKEIHLAVYKLFECATKKQFPMGLKHSCHSKTIYGIDVILEKKVVDEELKGVEPKILEINFCPEFKFLTDLSPTALNDCFSALYCNSGKNDINVVWL